MLLVRSPYHTRGQDNGDEGEENRAYQKSAIVLISFVPNRIGLGVDFVDRT